MDFQAWVSQTSGALRDLGISGDHESSAWSPLA